jgi:pyruvate, water dikinase
LRNLFLYKAIMQSVQYFRDSKCSDKALVGSKSAALAQLLQIESRIGIRVPAGFAVTSWAYRLYLTTNNLDKKLQVLSEAWHDEANLSFLAEIGRSMRKLIRDASIPEEVIEAIHQAYDQLCVYYGQYECAVAVRSSATDEDLPEASAAGQQDTFLHVRGIENILISYKECIASFFSDRALAYRRYKQINVMDSALGVSVQKMVCADRACSGTAFSLDPESGHKDVIIINAAYGLGTSVVGGLVNPDEFYVHKLTCSQGFRSLIKKQLGSKESRLCFNLCEKKLMKEITSRCEQEQFCLSDDEIFELARQVMAIENYYSNLNGQWTPMDIEWAKDAEDGLIYIVQARPETVHSNRKHPSFIQYSLSSEQPTEYLISGQSVGNAIVSGRARYVADSRSHSLFNRGDIIVTSMTDPDWVPLLRQAAGIITDAGGRTCHAAIVSRELGIPAVIGTGGATTIINNDSLVTIDCSKGLVGYVYSGALPFTKEVISLKEIPSLGVDLMVNVADPSIALQCSQLPVSGVGLVRLEFIIAHLLKVHPRAVVEPIGQDLLHKYMADKIRVYGTLEDFFMETCTQALGMIAAAFYPRPVVIRLTDFKSNEYRNLLGGELFEPVEENPMIGFRGAARYTHRSYSASFALECRVIKYVREKMGFVNCKIMIPFVRTVEEACRVIALLAEHGLERGKQELELYMMVEIPSNVLLIEKFAPLFDGFSIGSNDLTQLTLGVDRDSAFIKELFDERDPAVKEMLRMAIQGARKQGIPIGICGQAPSDFPEIAEFLIEQGINSLSLNHDSVVPFLLKQM